jgi:hypothetical protein
MDRRGTELVNGAEAILQVRAAALSDDERWAKHLAERLRRPFTRRSQSRKLSLEEIKG